MKRLIFLMFSLNFIAFSTSCTKGSTSQSNVSCGDLTDFDGNVYTSTKIGDLCWMQQNLNVSHYRNGDIIPQITDEFTWASLTTGAWCYYENNTADGKVYGKLYNWYAVNDVRGLAPKGWHISSDAELTTVTALLGGESVAGGPMKSTTGWNTPNVGATNSSGYAGLPGGFRNRDGVFLTKGDSGIWWTSTEADAGYAWFRGLYKGLNEVGRDNGPKTNGASVRCVKD